MLRIGALSAGLACLIAVAGIGHLGADEHAFIGAQKCKMCHNSKAKGAQFTEWTGTRHSRAYATLSSDQAKEIAARMGIAEPQKADECLSCHVTGHSSPAALLTGKYSVEEGVSCESCHGAGGDYWKMNVMKDRTRSVAAGLIIPDEATCATCHNDKSPTFNGFEFATSYARIAHPNPNAASR
jgi:cytochrome c peroxidase